MHINKTIDCYLLDKEEFLTWFDDKIYIFGVRYLKLLNKDKIIVELIHNYLIIMGTNMTIIKSSDNELLIKGEIHEIKKELFNI